MGWFINGSLTVHLKKGFFKGFICRITGSATSNINPKKPVCSPEQFIKGLTSHSFLFPEKHFKKPLCSFLVLFRKRGVFASEPTGVNI